MVSKRLYLGGLPHFVSGEQIAKYFSSYGRVVEVKLHDDYGFVEFASQKDATDVLNTYTNQSFLGANVVIEYSRHRRDSLENRESITPPVRGRLAPTNARIRYPVVVTNLSRTTCWQELKDFGRLGGSCVAFCDVDKTRRGRGFIEYLSQEDADHAIEVLNNKELCGNIVGVAAYNGHYLEGNNRSRSRSRSPFRRVLRDRSLEPTYERRRSKDHKRREKRKERGENVSLDIVNGSHQIKSRRR